MFPIISNAATFGSHFERRQRVAEGTVGSFIEYAVIWKKRPRSSYLQITIAMPSLSSQHHVYRGWESRFVLFFYVEIVEPWFSSKSNVSVPPETTGHLIRVRCNVESGRFVHGRFARFG